jgi:hypothetical protein
LEKKINVDMLKYSEHRQYLIKLKSAHFANNKLMDLFHKILFFSIISLSLLLAGCQRKDGGNKAMSEKIDRIIKNAENHLISMINEQEDYFSKHKSFFIPPEQKGEVPSWAEWVFTDPKTCYGYYPRPGDNIANVVDNIYIYAFQDACSGHSGFTLKLYVGAVFAVPLPGSKQVKTVSIICKENNTAFLSRIDVYQSPPKYTNGVLKCPPETTKVYFNSID